MPTNYFDTKDAPTFLGHFIGQVNLPFWSTPDEESKGKADYADSDKYKCYWNVNVLDILQEWENEDVESLNIAFGIGKQAWAPMANEPNLIRHEDDPGDEAVESGDAKPILFGEQSGYGQFLALISGKFKTYETDRGPAEVMDGGGPLDVNLRPLGQHFANNDIYDARDADIWKGLIFEFRGIGLKYGDQKPRMTPKPVRWLSDYDGAVDLAKLGEAGETASASTAQVWLDAGASADVADTLAKLAGSATSHAEFSKNALLLPAVKKDEMLSNAVMDESNGNWGS